MNVEEEKHVAYHEAAHAVIGLAFGQVLLGPISIIPDKDSLGRVHTESITALANPTREDCEHSILGLLAGYNAGIKSCHANKTEARECAWDDDKEIDRILNLLFDSEEQKEAALTDLNSKASDLVAQNWRAIKDLAAALIERKKVSPEEAELIVGVANNEIEEEQLNEFRKTWAHRL